MIALVILFCFGVVGLTHIVVDSAVMLPIRTFMKEKVPFIGKMMECYQCSGFWCGLICGACLFPMGCSWFISACAGSFLSNFAALYMNYMESKTIMNLNDSEQKQE